MGVRLGEGKLRVLMEAGPPVFVFVKPQQREHLSRVPFTARKFYSVT